MRRSCAGLALLPLMALFITGCCSMGDKTASISVIYSITAILSLLLFVGYCSLRKKKNIWYLLLFVSILVVNTGYFALSVSENLEQALFANRIAYLGSVFLPLSMWMIILNTTHIRYGKWMPGLLLVLASVVFLIAASAGYLPIYYKEVSFEKVNGVSTLVKVYGPLHVVNLIHLMGYFVTMVVTIIYAIVKKKIDSVVHTTILAMAVFVNIGVWFVEQLVQVDFEILSFSYVISGFFLLGLKLLMAETQKLQSVPQESNPKAPSTSFTEQPLREQLDLFLAGLPILTPKEKEIYNCYVAGMTTADIMQQLNIKENTLKFHNKNLYSKLGVKSRKQLMILHGAAFANDPSLQ